MDVRRPRVLLVDDERESLDLMAQALGDRVEAVQASSGPEALQLVWASPFDLCISDLHMPGMSGLELVGALKETAPLMGRILVSAFADSEALLGAINEGAIFRFVPKPFTATQLRSAVEEYLRSAGSSEREEWVLVVDDSPTMRFFLEQLLRGAGFQVVSAQDGKEALERLSEREPAIAIMDLDMPGMSGLEVVAEAKKVAPQVPVMVLSSHAQHHLALDAMASGAFDFMSKPVSREELLFRVKRAINARRQLAELSALKATDGPGKSRLVAESPAMRAVLAKARAAAASDATVLITGETGAGKDALAREIHRLSARSTQPFLAINCGALPETLLESELFGYEKGAFTGAQVRRKGYFEMADGGTLFLDEVGEMSPATQVKLLRVLEDQQFARLGGTQPVRVDVRVIAATNRNLEEMVQTKAFRADLYYRLFVVPLRLPSLRERAEDIRGLIQLALSRADPRGRLRLSPQVLAEALAYSWPGNVRELFNCIARAVVLAQSDRIETLHLAGSLVLAAVDSAEQPTTAIDRPLKQFMAEILSSAEKGYLRALLQQTEGNLGEAAKLAGLDRKSVYNKMKAYGLTKEEFKSPGTEEDRALAADPD